MTRSTDTNGMKRSGSDCVNMKLKPLKEFLKPICPKNNDKNSALYFLHSKFNEGVQEAI